MIDRTNSKKTEEPNPTAEPPDLCTTRGKASKLRMCRSARDHVGVAGHHTCAVQ